MATDDSEGLLAVGKTQYAELPLSDEFTWFKRRIEKFVVGGIYLLAGQPGIGKSTLGIQLALDLGRRGKKTLYILTEQSKEDLALRARGICSSWPQDQIKAALSNIYPLVGNLGDCYPELDNGLVETVKQLGAQYHKDSESTAAPPTAPIKVVEPTIGIELSAGAQKVVEKLWRGDYWGKKAISRDFLRNHLCRNVKDLEDVLEVLIGKELLLAQGKDGPFSLNLKLKSNIEAVARHSAGQQ